MKIKDMELRAAAPAHELEVGDFFRYKNGDKYQYRMIVEVNDEERLFCPETKDFVRFLRGLDNIRKHYSRKEKYQLELVTNYELLVHQTKEVTL